MNKNLLLASVLAGATLIGITGCGDDPQPVVVDPKFSYTANQQFTYESTPRDTNQTPTTAEMRNVKWTVVETGLTYQGRTEVTKIKQERMAADGTTVEATDTLYISASADGSWHQFDVIGSVIRRIPNPAAVLIADELPKTWTKIGDTKNSSSLSYDATAQSTIQITNAALPLPVKVTYSIRGQHKGKTSVTVPLKTEANAFSTDLIIKLKATDGSGTIELTNDSLMFNNTVSVADGILSQSLQSKTVYFRSPPTFAPAPQVLLGYDMKLKAKQ
jgi:hypothetical protein